MTLPQSVVIRRFVIDENSKGSASNVFIEDGVLYSTDKSFPLLIRVPHWDNNPHTKTYKVYSETYKAYSDEIYKKAFILNADRGWSGVFGGGTSLHQWQCFKYATIQIPFSALEKAIPEIFEQSNFYNPINLNFEELELIDKTEERWDCIGYKHRDTGKFISANKFSRNDISNRESIQYEAVKERRPESVVLKFRDRYYLSSMDDTQYFIVHLPKPVRSVDEAFDILKPPQVKGKEYKRQGEWFFIELELPEKEIKRTYKILSQNFILPKDDPRSNDHIATRGGWIMDIAFSKKPNLDINAKTPIVSGQIRHPEHRMLKLSTLDNCKIFVAFENTALGSWSAEGKVD